MTDAVYSIWALPPETVKRRVQNVMKALNSEFGGPEFEPHITVVGATRLSQDLALQKLRAAASTLQPFTANVAAISTGKSFFQSVYLLIEPSHEIMAARSRFCMHFGGDEHFMPHLSLLYGDLSEEERQRAAAMVASEDSGLLGLSFNVSSLALYKTDTSDKTLESWEKVFVHDM